MRSVCESQENQRRSRRGLPQKPQTNDSIDAEVSNLLVRPVFLLTTFTAAFPPGVAGRRSAGRSGDCRARDSLGRGQQAGLYRITPAVITCQSAEPSFSLWWPWFLPMAVLS